MRNLSSFAVAIGRGLGEAVQTDVDVFLLTVAGGIYPVKPLRGLSAALGVYVLLRRADMYVDLFANKLDRLGTAISVSQQIEH